MKHVLAPGRVRPGKRHHAGSDGQEVRIGHDAVCTARSCVRAQSDVPPAESGNLGPMIDADVKAHLHDHLRWVREALVWKLEGLSEYDVRRPLTSTGTNLLGLVKHNAVSDSRYFGEVFGRPFPESLARWDDARGAGSDFWATDRESRADIVDLYRRVWAHSDATMDALDLDALGYVPWWDEEVRLFNVMVHRSVRRDAPRRTCRHPA